MFCPNCGKKSKETAHFCRYCGLDLIEETFPEADYSQRLEGFAKDKTATPSNVSSQDAAGVKVKSVQKPKPLPEVSDNIKPKKENPVNNLDEELVLHVWEKHWMGLFLPILFSPFFIACFWKIYVSSHSMLGASLGLILLIPVIYPILRHFSDKIVITNKYVHIKYGIFDIEEIDIPINNLADEVHVKESFFSSSLDYGYITFYSPAKDKRCSLRYIIDPAGFKYIINNSTKYIEDALEEDPFRSLSNSAFAE